MLTKKNQNRLARKRRVKAKVTGTAGRPRLTVYRSLYHIYAQIIDDDAGETLASVHTKEIKSNCNKEGAKKAGELLAKKAKEKKITRVVFDRNGYRYHGCIKELAQAARDGGLTF